MAFIPEERIYEVKHSADIVSIISDYVPLKRSGRNFVGSCPFHREKTPSFTVSPEKQIFHCFGCGAGGDVFTFIMEMEQLEYPKAVRFLADRLGIFIESDSQDYGKYKRLNKLTEINEEARKFYFKNLLNSKIPQNYLSSRGFGKNIINQFQLGYAGNEVDSLYRHMKSLGYDEEDLLELGLIAESDYDDGYYDKYRDRLIFPIHNTKNEVVAFGGRTLVDHPAKYMNSKDSMLYDKSKNIYGTRNIQSIRRENQVLITEGYLDVIALYEGGFETGVASLGTAFTEEQAKLISRYTKNVYLAFDGDEAGKIASMRAIDVFLSLEIFPKVMQFPEGLDPDDYLKKYGSEAFQKLIDQAIDPIQFLLMRHTSGKNLSNIPEKLEIAQEMIEHLLFLERKIAREEYMKQVCRFLDLEYSTFQSEFQNVLETEQTKTKRQEERQQKQQEVQKRQNQTESQHLESSTNLQKRLYLGEALRLITYNPYSIEKIEELNHEFQTIFTLWDDWIDFFLEMRNEDQTLTPEIFKSRYPDAKRQINYIFNVRDSEYYRDKEFLERFITALQRDIEQSRRAEILQEIEILEEMVDLENRDEKLRELLIELVEIDQKIKG